MEGQIKLLQFFVCRDFHTLKQDQYEADGILGNLYSKTFPFKLGKLYAVTCWRKDERFHKEVIEYSTDYGETIKSPHMDIEPVTNSVLFRWHKHLFPGNLMIKQPTVLTVRVILDWDIKFETYLLIEKTP